MYLFTLKPLVELGRKKKKKIVQHDFALGEFMKISSMATPGGDGMVCLARPWEESSALML